MLRAPISQAGSTRRGMVAAQIVLSLSALMAMLAVVADGGLLLADRRHAQATADAAALAAASDLYENWYKNSGLDPGGTASASAMSVASANFYTNDGTTWTVTVNIPPKTGIFINKPGYAEVIVTCNQQRFFSGVFGSGAIPVSARAVAQGVVQPSQPAVLLLSLNASPPPPPPALTVNGGLVVVDSSPANPTADPLGYIPQPTTTGMTTQSSSPLSVSGTTTLSPGVYNGGISISGTANVTLQSGVYYMQGGGFSVSGSANVNVTGNDGVMIYNDASGGSLSISSTGSVGLGPMTTGGAYAGITLFQARTATAPVSISGNGTTNISGTIYAANAPLSLSVSGIVSNLGNQYIASTLTISGTGLLTVDYDPSTVATVAMARDFGLVE